MTGELRTWADVYNARAALYDNPLDICEFYHGEQHVDGAWLQSVANLIAGRLQLDRRHRVLEVGCGCGVLLNELRSSGATFTGLDPAPRVLARAAEFLPDVQFVLGSAEKLPFDSHSFDKCFAYQVFHYLGDFDKARLAILEMLRVVRPGGRILIGQVPNAQRESDYRQFRLQRGYQRQAAVTHELRWLWFPPEFFEQFHTQFTAVEIVTGTQDVDINYQFRMDVVLTLSSSIN